MKKQATLAPLSGVGHRCLLFYSWDGPPVDHRAPALPWHQGPGLRGGCQGPPHPQHNLDLTFQCPPPTHTARPGQTAWTFLDPLILQVQGHSRALWGLWPPCPRPGPSQDNRAGGQASAARAGFTAWPAGLLVLRWASCRICPIIWTVGFNSHCVLARSPANIAGRHPLHASRPLPSHTAHPYSKLKI